METKISRYKMTTFEEHLLCKYCDACFSCGCCNCKQIRVKAINEYKQKVKETMQIIADKEGHDTCCGMTLEEFMKELGL